MDALKEIASSSVGLDVEAKDSGASENSTALGSTTLDSEASGDSGDCMTTGSRSKLSRSRPESQRGPKRKQRRLERAERHVKAKGLVWVPQEEEKQKFIEDGKGFGGKEKHGKSKVGKGFGGKEKDGKGFGGKGFGCSEKNGKGFGGKGFGSKSKNGKSKDGKSKDGKEFSGKKGFGDEGTCFEP